MPDNWGFVLAAYTLTALALGAYWRRLIRLERDLAVRIDTLKINRSSRTPPHPPGTGHPQAKPASRPPLQ